MTLDQSQFAWLESRLENRYTQFGEWGLLNAIFERIGTNNKWCLEVGASDGLFFSNTRGFIEQGWNALLIEAEEPAFHRLAALYSGNKSVTCFNYRVATSGVHTLDRLLEKVKAPKDIDLVVIDIDSFDYHIFNSLLRHRPRVVVCEYNPATDKDFIPEIGGEGQAGLNATVALGIGRYYFPVAITSTNIIFVQQELCEKLVETFEDRHHKFVEESHNEYMAKIEGHRHESHSGSSACVHCGITGVWPLVKPPIGNRIELHQAKEEGGDCFKCGKPWDKWAHGDQCEGKPRAPKLAAVMSTPRLGFLATMDCIFAGLMPLGVPLLRGEGAYWGQTLERAIEKAVNEGADYVLTFDYDVVFETKHGNNDVAKLVCLMEDNPEVDCIVSAQMKREKGALLATSDKEIRLLDELVPITQGHFGLTIFKASAFAKIPKPWLRDWPNDKGEWGENRVDADIFFWQQAVKAGLDIRLALDVMVGHIEQVVTWPGQNLETVYQSLSEWREHGRPAESFYRQRVIEAVKMNPALLYGPKLEMGD